MKYEYMSVGYVLDEHYNIYKAKDEIETTLNDEFKNRMDSILKRIGIINGCNGLEYYIPRYYNFELDSVNIDVEIEREYLGETIKKGMIDKLTLLNNMDKIWDELDEALNNNHSHDGFISLTPYNAEKAREDIINGAEPDAITMRMLIDYIDPDIKNDIRWRIDEIYTDKLGD